MIARFGVKAVQPGYSDSNFNPKVSIIITIFARQLSRLSFMIFVKFSNVITNT